MNFSKFKTGMKVKISGIRLPLKIIKISKMKDNIELTGKQSILLNQFNGKMQLYKPNGNTKLVKKIEVIK